MRVAALGVSLAVLVGAASCSGDTSSTQALVPLLLKDAEVIGVVPELNASTDYSTGADYGTIANDEFSGPIKKAIAAVVRQWSREAGATNEGHAWSVVSAVTKFASAADAQAAAEALLNSLPSGTVSIAVAGTRGGVTPTVDGLSSGDAVTTLDSVLVSLHVLFVGQGDRSTFSQLAELVAQRVR